MSNTRRRRRRRRRKSGVAPVSKAGNIDTTLSVTDLFFDFPNLQGKTFRKALRDPFRQYPWVYASISSWARNIGRVNWQMNQGDPRGDSEPVDQHDYLDLLREPNAEMSGEAMLRQAIMISLGITGEAILVKESGVDSQLGPREIPKELWPVWPSLMDEVVDRDTGLIVGWMLRVGAKTIPYLPHEVVHIRFYDPKSKRGLSPLSAARQAVDVDWKASVYDEGFFENNANPGGVLSSEQRIDNKTRDETRKEWEERYGGYMRAHRLAILGKGLKYIPFDGGNRVEMQYVEGRTINRRTVAAVYGVPPIELGLYDEVSHESARVQRKIYWENVLLPIWSGVLDVLNGRQFLTADPVNKGFFFTADTTNVPVLQEDYGERVKQGRLLWSMGVPFDSLNKKLSLGIDEFEGSDQSFLPSGVLPADMAGKPRVAPSNGQGTARVVSLANINLIEKRDDAVGIVTRDVFNPQERRWRGEISRYMSRLRTEVLRDFDRIASAADPALSNRRAWEALRPKTRNDALLLKRFLDRCKAPALTPQEVEAININRGEWDAELGRIALLRYQETTAAAVDVTSAELGGFQTFGGASDPRILAFIAGRVPQVAEGVNSTVALGVRQSILVGLSKEETFQEMRRRLSHVLNVSGKRSATIARTEVGIGANGTRFEAMKAEAVGRHKWSTAGDTLVRAGPFPKPDHSRLEGEEQKIGDPFTNGLLYPLQPGGPAGEIINCRCLALAVID